MALTPPTSRPPPPPKKKNDNNNNNNNDINKRFKHTSSKKIKIFVIFIG